MQKNPSYLDFITKSLYIDMAKKFRTSSACIERSVRTAISTIWKTNNLKLLYEICGNEFIERPTNKEFFSLFYRYLSREEQEVKTEEIMEYENVETYSYCDFTCDDCGEDCEQLKKIYQQMMLLSLENRKLKERLNRVRSYEEKIEKKIVEEMEIGENGEEETGKEGMNENQPLS